MSKITIEVYMVDLDMISKRMHEVQKELLDTGASPFVYTHVLAIQLANCIEMGRAAIDAQWGKDISVLSYHPGQASIEYAQDLIKARKMIDQVLAEVAGVRVV